MGLALHLHNYGADPVPGHGDVHPLHLPDGDDSLPTGQGQIGDGGSLIPSLDQGGDVPTVLQWVGGGLHGEAGGTKQVQAGGPHQLKFGECTASLHFSR